MRLICNSIPKSGTYLLAALAQYIGFNDQGIRFVDNGINVVDEANNMVQFLSDSAAWKLDRLSRGSFAPSHLTYNDELAGHIAAAGFKHIFIYRHPGDVIYSYVRFVTYSTNFRDQSSYNAELQARMKSQYQSDEERVVSVFLNMASAFNFEENIRWLDCAACHPVRFEDLYVELIAAGDGTEIGPTLNGIFEYVGANPYRKPQSVFEGVYGRGPTFAEGRDKVERFRELDANRMAPLLSDPKFVEFTQMWGYASYA